MKRRRNKEWSVSEDSKECSDRVKAEIFLKISSQKHSLFLSRKPPTAPPLIELAHDNRDIDRSRARGDVGHRTGGESEHVQGG